MILSGFNDINSLYTTLKKSVDFRAVEGVAQPSYEDRHEVELVLLALRKLLMMS